MQYKIHPEKTIKVSFFDWLGLQLLDAFLWLPDKMNSNNWYTGALSGWWFSLTGKYK